MRYTALLFTIAAIAGAQHLLYPLPPDTAVTVVKSTVYRTIGDKKLEFDLYRPTGIRTAPVVIFLNGIGSNELKRWPIYQDWGRVVTGQGLAGITMDSRLEDVSGDFRALLDYLHAHQTELHVDADQVLLWACSANVQAGLPIAMDPRNKELRAAVIYYGNGVVKDFRPDVPVLYARVGTDNVEQNKTIDATVARALSGNAPWTVINLPAARHAFDARDDNPVTRQVIARTLDFLKAQSMKDIQETQSAGIPESVAVAAMYREDWNAAVTAYASIAEQKPRDSEVRRNYGNALFSAGQYKRAISEYERALALGNYNTGWISYNAAVASVKLGETDAAMRWIEKLKDIEPMRKRLAASDDFAPLRSNPLFREIAGHR